VLAPYRVLDLCAGRTHLCGQILAALGADVIAVEPPGGSPLRREPPFAGDRPDPESSLAWWAYARGKRSVVLDLETAAGRAAFLDLAAQAAFVIESFPPGTMARLGLDWPSLATVNPRLVHVSITPWGRTGPRADWRATDLVLWAAAGPMHLTGDADRPPIRLPVPQSELHAAAEAAVAALVAHHERMRSGHGQHVDVSAQQAIALATQSYILCDAIGHAEIRRVGGGLRNGPLDVRMLFPARDGHVAITFLFGSAIGPFTRRLMAWIAEEGGCDAATRDKDWMGYTSLLLSGAEPLAEYERVKDVVAAFTATRTKAELLAAALARGLLIAPVATLDEVLANPHLGARAYWEPVPRPDGRGTIPMPGAFARFSRTPLRPVARAPRLDEHAALLRDVRPAHAAVAPDEAGPATPALADVRVLDLMWVMAGPSATRALADYGATVVRVESTTRLDTARTLAPYVGNVPGPESSGIFHNLNVGKRMMTLDLRTPEGCAVVLDLVEWADVVTESFSPGVMARLGLGYPTLAARKPGIIMLSTSLMGQTGPLASFAGYGNLAAAISGFSNLGGWPDRPPAGPFSAYTDYVSPRFVAVAILAALEHRRRTGEGQYIDLAQGEASLHFLAPALLDYAINARLPTRIGNRDPTCAPHGVYPALGEDAWVAIAVTSDAEWRAFAALIDPALAADERYRDAAGRLAAADALDARVGAWTAAQDRHACAARLQAAGVPASAVQTSADLLRDPQLASRGHFVRVAHPLHGHTTVEGPRVALSRTPARVAGPAPSFGADNDVVLREILGYDDARITALVAAGALA
jgi:crotonobetainyl-CoA:carnitine CoA-transferase CaiB-like acyl-CoA transferase